MTLILSESDIDQVLEMDDCLRVIEQTFTDFALGEAVSRPRSHTYTYLEPDTFYNFKSMDGCVPRYGVHALRISSEHLQKQRILGHERLEALPKARGGRYVGLIVLFDLATTEPIAILQDSGVQRMRVGATSGVAAKYAAREDAVRVGLFGTGWQAKPQLEALSFVRNLQHVNVYSLNRDHREQFAKEMSAQFSFPIVAVDEPREVVRGADIIACATSSQEPVFDGAWLEPGQHVNSVTGGEIDATTLSRATSIIVRSFEKSLNYLQEASPESPALMGEATGYGREPVNFDQKLVDLGSIVAGVKHCRTSREDVTLFGGGGTGPSAGLGIQFTAVGKLAYDLARSRGLGHEIPTEWLTQMHHT